MDYVSLEEDEQLAKDIKDDQEDLSKSRSKQCHGSRGGR
jgi:hypothetical protein